jgi:hypothetical protein
MAIIRISDFSKEAASRTRGLLLKERLEEALGQSEPIVVDFSGINRFASPFFNNSFAVLAYKFGFPAVEAISLENISETGRQTYESSMENAKDIYQDKEMSERIMEIVGNTPKKAGV